MKVMRVFSDSRVIHLVSSSRGANNADGKGREARGGSEGKGRTK